MPATFTSAMFVHDGQPIHEYATCWCMNPGGTITCWCHGENGDDNLPPEHVLERHGLTRPAVKITPETRRYKLRNDV